MQRLLSRREFQTQLSAGVLAATGSSTLIPMFADAVTGGASTWQPKYLLASSLYGRERLERILPEVSRTAATAIDLWPEPHGNQREQLDELGEDAASVLFSQHRVRWGCVSQFKRGPFGLRDEMRVCHRWGCETIVTGSSGPKGLTGNELKQAVVAFAEKLKPHLELAEECGVTLAIENHANSLIQTPESIHRLMDACPHRRLGIALAPYHLEQDADQIARLIRELGERLSVFYAWQHGKGCFEKLPKDEELLQLPGRGSLDFRPIMEALSAMNYSGWVEIFMHPVPRGVPILDTPEQVTDAIVDVEQHLAECLRR